MPELPDLTAYLEALAARLGGETFERLRVVSPFVLRSVSPAASELEGRGVVGLRRLGKRLVVALEGDYFLVVHLMIAGRLTFRPRVAPGRPAAARNVIAAFEFSSGTLFLTEAGAKRRASLYLVYGEAELATHDPGGIEPLAAGLADFRRALSAENRTLKRALTDPRLVAGIGNAYSDEILHAARLSPFARTGDLSEESWRRLHVATQATLELWIERLRREADGRFPDKVTAFRPEMAVHGRFGLPCPVCGTPVQRIVYAGNEANYCPVCQTGGKLLADRLLSRLLHDDWPKSVEELEEKKTQARTRGGVPGLVVVALAAGLILLAACGPAGAAVEPPLGRSVQLPLPLPGLSPDPARLARARAILGPAARESWLGGYRFLTDLGDAALTERTAKLVGALESVYLERYGRRPVGTPREAIVLFSSEADFRLYQAGDPRVAGLAGSTGLAGSGIVATYRGMRTDDEMLGTLVHELTHLLNRRALGPSLPSWLDEGLADDLGASRIDAAGRLLPGSWSRALEPHEREIRISGGEAALRELIRVLEPAETWPEALDLSTVLGLDWEEFVAPEGAEIHYAVAAAFIRMLLAEPAQRTLFRAWLAEVSEGASPRAEELRQLLALPWSDLEAELSTWARVEKARLPPLRPEEPASPAGPAIPSLPSSPPAKGAQAG